MSRRTLAPDRLAVGLILAASTAHVDDAPGPVKRINALEQRVAALERAIEASNRRSQFLDGVYQKLRGRPGEVTPLGTIGADDADEAERLPPAEIAIADIPPAERNAAVIVTLFRRAVLPRREGDRRAGRRRRQLSDGGSRGAAIVPRIEPVTRFAPVRAQTCTSGGWSSRRSGRPSWSRAGWP
jgi:hypothetical protein